MERVLRQIEENNPTLKAAAAEVEAERLSGRAEALLSNPEVEFNYLWGAENIGGRHDVRISQAFDVPTLTGMKARRAGDIGELASLRFKAERQDILLEAKQTCIDLVYYNAILTELKTHLEQSSSLVDAYEKRMKAGEATVLDLNKARIHQTSVQGQANRAEVERQVLVSTLRTLNGGIDIEFDATSYDILESLPSDFDSWLEEACENSPMLSYVRKQVDLEDSQLAIDKASRLPELAVGYMSEIRTVEKFRGVTFGVNIPLWSAENKVRQSRARVEAAKERRNAAEQEFLQELRMEYGKAYSMKENSEMMRSSLHETDSREFLLSALSKGEISMIDYLVEIDLYYDALEATLEAERDYRHALASLTAFNL
ncbi:MAG: TolC family protein [Bacteroidales bacterium]|nr:TolC family protein [Bacteroidales bacterium]